jgi:hypothetical protein
MRPMMTASASVPFILTACAARSPSLHAHPLGPPATFGCSAASAASCCTRRPDSASSAALGSFRNRFTHVRGNPLEREELKPLILQPGLHSVIVFNEQLTSEPSAKAMDVVVCAANVESMLPPGNTQVRVLVALNSSSDMRFVDRTSWWPSSDDPFYGHVSSSTFASGTAIADEMLYPLMMGWFKHGLIEFCTKLTDGVLDPTEVKLIELPRQFYTDGKHTYTVGDMVAPLMSAGMLPIALYRKRSGASARYLLPYVLTCPPHSTQLRNSDRVYVLMRQKGSHSYTHSVKRLERAARSLQRHWRERAQTLWARRYWQEQLAAGSSIESIEVLTEPSNIAQISVAAKYKTNASVSPFSTGSTGSPNGKLSMRRPKCATTGGDSSASPLAISGVDSSADRPSTSGGSGEAPARLSGSDAAGKRPPPIGIPTEATVEPLPTPPSSSKPTFDL